MRNIEEIIEKNRVALTERDKEANKGSYGRLLVIGGSRGMAGAAYLASLAAFRTGIGMVKVFGPECNRCILQTRLPEAMYQSAEAADGSIDEKALLESIAWADYVVAGPGLSKSTSALELMRRLCCGRIAAELADKKMLLFDADALNLIAFLMNDIIDPDGERLLKLCSNTVITPHIGEMSRLTGLEIADIKVHKAELAESFAKRFRIAVILKDAVTAVAVGEETMLIDSGCPAMAKAGSGDVLCGITAGITAVLKGKLCDSLPAAVWLHGSAGRAAAAENGCHGILAGEIADAAASVLAHI